MKVVIGSFLLPYGTNQSMRPDQILCTVSKILYMVVERDLHMYKVVDSLDFLPMKLLALPKAFDF